MNTGKLLFLNILCSLIISCGEKDTEVPFEIRLKEGKTSYSLGESVEAGLVSNTGEIVDSVVYIMDSRRLGKQNSAGYFKFSTENHKVGARKISAQLYYDGKESTVSKTITLLSPHKPKLYTYTIKNEYPHDINAYTQGLEFHGDFLYESTGQYGKSSLRKTNYKTGEVLEQFDLGEAYFGEGLTILNNRIYQLTWRENVGFIYNLETMERTGNFVYGESKEGWGLSNDSEVIYKSDGTEKIWILNKENLAEESYIEIYTNTSKIKSVNELEWVEGKIYANIYQRNAIAIINPENGAVEGVIDLSGLQAKVKQHPGLDVLNGIAYKGDKNHLFITGKNWDKLFEIEIIEK